MKFPGDYRGETVVSNGNAVWVAFSNSNQSRSPFASFLITYDVIVRDDLLGGALSTAWALSDVAELRPKLVYEGLKKLDGQQLHQLRHEPRKHTDVQILIFLDSDFRHVKTTYSISYSISVGNLPGQTITEESKLQPERSRLDERFSDFKRVDALIHSLESRIHARASQRQHDRVAVGSGGRPDHQQYGSGPTQFQSEVTSNNLCSMLESSP